MVAGVAAAVERAVRSRVLVPRTVTFRRIGCWASRAGPPSETACRRSTITLCAPGATHTVADARASRALHARRLWSLCRCTRATRRWSTDCTAASSRSAPPSASGSACGRTARHGRWCSGTARQEERHPRPRCGTTPRPNRGRTFRWPPPPPALVSGMQVERDSHSHCSDGDGPCICIARSGRRGRRARGRRAQVATARLRGLRHPRAVAHARRSALARRSATGGGDQPGRAVVARPAGEG